MSDERQSARIHELEAQVEKLSGMLENFLSSAQEKVNPAASGSSSQDALLKIVEVLQSQQEVQEQIVGDRELSKQELRDRVRERMDQIMLPAPTGKYLWNIFPSMAKRRQPDGTRMRGAKIEFRCDSNTMAGAMRDYRNFSGIAYTTKTAIFEPVGFTAQTASNKKKMRQRDRESAAA